MPLKILTNLTGSVSKKKTFVEPRGVLQTVHDEPKPGFFRHATLGHGGVVIKRRTADAKGNITEIGVAIPMEELIALAEAHEPLLVP